MKNLWGINKDSEKMRFESEPNELNSLNFVSELSELNSWSFVSGRSDELCG